MFHCFISGKPAFSGAIPAAWPRAVQGATSAHFKFEILQASRHARFHWPAQKANLHWRLLPIQGSALFEHLTGKADEIRFSRCCAPPADPLRRPDPRGAGRRSQKILPLPAAPPRIAFARFGHELVKKRSGQRQALPPQERALLLLPRAARTDLGGILKRIGGRSLLRAALRPSPRAAQTRGESRLYRPGRQKCLSFSATAAVTGLDCTGSSGYEMRRCRRAALWRPLRLTWRQRISRRAWVSRYTPDKMPAAPKHSCQ